MLPPIDQIKAALERQAKTVAIDGANLVVEAGDLLNVCRFLKDSPDYAMDYVSNLTAVDYPPDLPAAPTGAQTSAAQAGRIEMVYHLFSMAKKHGPIGLKVILPRTTPVVDSLTKVYRGAEFQEREVYDLFGVRFEGHPDLRRILMWDGFEGHPMRKDYVVENQDEPIAARPAA